MNTVESPKETYTQLKDRHSKEFGEFKGVFFAFSNEQFTEGMKKLGLKVNNTGIASIVPMGAGGYLLKANREAYRAMVKRQREEKAAAQTDGAFLLNAIIYELGNHEYGYSYDHEEALDAVGVTESELPDGLLQKAINLYLGGFEG